MTFSMPAGYPMTTELLLCTDLDRTLIPNGPQPESASARQRFKQLVTRPEITMAYVSGRDRELVKTAIEAYQLPIPDFVIADVGTTLYQIDSHQQWVEQTAWQQQIGRDWAGKTNAQLSRLLNDINELQRQEDHKQNRFKLSYYVSPTSDRKKLSSRIQARLNQAGVRVRLIWSADETTNTRLLDILPARASKLHAIEALMKQLDFDTDNTLFSGDSGNDLEVLVSPIPSVLVGNSQQEIQQQAIHESKLLGNQTALYIASGQSEDMNGNYSAGIIEGIAHFYPHITEFIQFE